MMSATFQMPPLMIVLSLFISGALSAQEFSPKMPSLSEQQFQKLDQNANGELSLEELVGKSPAATHAKLRQGWMIADFDRSGGLSLREYECLPSAGVVASLRKGVPDPVQAAADEELAQARKRFASIDQNQDGQLDEKEWALFSKETFYAEFRNELDQDGDRRISLAELERGLQVAFGLADVQGAPLRRDSGQIFTWRTFVLESDKNLDGQIDREELLKSLTSDATQQELFFQELDQNKDGRLSVEELAAHERFWMDVLRKYLVFDLDLDGELSPDELASKVPSWEQGYVSSQFPGYDLDRNGKLSFLEYRGSPLGNQILIWMGQKDLDHDGRLSLAEYHPVKTLAFLGQSKLFFDRLDQNHSGYLELNEYGFSIDIQKVPAEIAFTSLDRDRDGTITQQELFTEDDSQYTSPRQQQTEIRFIEIDKNHDKKLTLDEFRSGKGSLLAEAMDREARFRATLRSRFEVKDINKDQRLSLEEWLTNTSPDQAASLNQQFAVCDFNGDQHLAFSEYANLPSICVSIDRTGISDPVWIAAEAEIFHAQERFHAFDANQDGQLSKPEWKSYSGELFYADLLPEFDRDGNGHVSLSELEHGLKVAYGLIDPQGVALRRSSGQIFNWRGYPLELDKDKNGALSPEEIQGTFPAPPENQQKMFREFDSDANEELNVAELAAQERFWVDTLQIFLLYDVNKDGMIAQEEIAEKAASWEASYVASLFPAYDVDGSGALSYLEFRGTPMSNRTLIWMGQKDLDHDGRLSLAEYHPAKTLAFLGQSKLFFDRLDRNRDGRLDRSELDFPIDLQKVPPQIAFQFLDQDRNEKLTEQEILTGRSELENIRFQRLRPLFFKVDQNSNGEVTLEEFQTGGGVPLAVAVEKERQSWHAIQSGFKAKDSNQDRRLSLEEWISGAPPQQQASLKQQFIVVDFDHSGELSLLEYGCLPSVSSAVNRAGIPDPIRIAAIEELAQSGKRFASADQNQDGQLDEKEWEEFSKETFYAGFLNEFDQDSDQRISLAELERGLAVAYGLADRQGTMLRRNSGQIFTWRTFLLERDKNLDGQIDREELPKNLTSDATQQERLFQELDRNNDDQLSIEELAAHERFWMDVLGKFLTFDLNLDGELSPEEIAEKAPSWEQGYVNSQFPGYDLDGNGKLSFLEYRGSPLGNQVLVWMGQKDQDHDGRLSFAEYHPAKTLAFLGQSKLFFDRLDQDRSGSLDWNEYGFSIDFQKVPAEIAFKLLDQNRDGTLMQQEIFYIKEEENPELDSQRYNSSFLMLDKNNDGRITLEEYDAGGGTAIVMAVRKDKASRAAFRSNFDKKDTDHNHQLSLEELTTGLAHGQIAALKQQFQICDFDRNDHLSLEEYRCLPGMSATIDRIGIPDPIRVAAEEELAQARKRFPSADQNQDDQLDAMEWQSFSSNSFYARFSEEFDQDGDQRISLNELESGLHVAYGLTDVQGIPLRRDSGQLFNWRTIIHERDKNQDGQLDRTELLKTLTQNAAQHEALFRELDQDKDDLLSIKELVPQERFWIDVLARFLTFDQDRDGELSPAEIAEKTPYWEQGYVASQFPGYDLDRNGKLSLAEFRGSPLGNQVLIWMGQKDLDHDGRLSLTEFHPTKSLAFLGQSKLFFDRIDLNQSGFLELNEYSFPVDFQKAPVEVVFQALDRNGDQKLTLPEIFATEEEPMVTPHFSQHHDLFPKLDQNSDGTVTMPEFQQGDGRALAIAAQKEKQFRTTIQSSFKTKDVNQDQHLSLEEFLASTLPDQASSLKQQFVVCDFNGDQQLSFSEYTNLPSMTVAIDRMGIPDPIRAAAEAEIVQAQERLHAFDANQDGQLSKAEWTSYSRDLFYADYLPEFDRDTNGQISGEELKMTLEVIYGLTDPQGVALRRDSGQIFNWRGYPLELDQDKNGMLSPAEIQRTFPAPLENQQKMFREFDDDANGELSVAELAMQERFWIDTLQIFLLYDVNKDGMITPEEIAEKAASWESGYVPSLFPAYDTDGSGTLSYLEFRGTPMSNRTQIWISPKDQNHDGCLSLAEFHMGKTLAFLGQSKLFFDRLDRNRDGRLDRSELDFPIDLQKVPPQIAFQYFDANSDQQVDLQEFTRFDQYDGTDPAQRQRQHARLMRLEEAFQAIDKNRDEQITLEEYQLSHQIASTVNTGKKAPAKVTNVIASRYARNEKATDDSRWRWGLLIVANVLLVGGIGWLVLKSA